MRLIFIYTYLFVDVVRNEENQVGGRCQSEMNAHRKMLMDDYNISPEVVSKCAKDIQVSFIIKAYNNDVIFMKLKGFSDFSTKALLPEIESVHLNQIYR